jgi:hypothetical protein
MGEMHDVALVWVRLREIMMWSMRCGRCRGPGGCQVWWSPLWMLS